MDGWTREAQDAVMAMLEGPLVGGDLIYRGVLFFFGHQSGSYYWDRLLVDEPSQAVD